MLKSCKHGNDFTHHAIIIHKLNIMGISILCTDLQQLVVKLDKRIHYRVSTKPDYLFMSMPRVIKDPIESTPQLKSPSWAVKTEPPYKLRVSNILFVLVPPILPLALDVLCHRSLKNFSMTKKM